MTPGRTVLWGGRRRDRQVGSDADHQAQAELWFLYTHCHLERLPAPVGHAVGLAAGRVLRAMARAVER